MCYSAMVEQDFKKLGLKEGDVVDVSLFRELFRRRFEGENIYIPKGMESNFLGEPKSDAEAECKELILGFRRNKLAEEEGKLFGFKRRLVEAERKLAEKSTKSQQKEKEVCERQIERTKERLERIQAPNLVPDDIRIFPLGWAPLLILREGKRVVVPARYHLRPQGQGPEFDRKFDGNYNARRENLEKVPWWKTLFGRNHGILVVHKFFENVPRHKFEHRDLKPGEKPENVVLEFTPSNLAPMYVAALYDVWPSKQNVEFYSAAAITMDPPPEVAQTGHERCIVPIPEGLVSQWLESGKSLDAYYSILDKRIMPYYKHQVAI